MSTPTNAWTEHREFRSFGSSPDCLKALKSDNRVNLIMTITSCLPTSTFASLNHVPGNVQKRLGQGSHFLLSCEIWRVNWVDKPKCTDPEAASMQKGRMYKQIREKLAKFWSFRKKKTPFASPPPFPHLPLDLGRWPQREEVWRLKSRWRWPWS